jgi:hypothetical protein
MSFETATYSWEGAMQMHIITSVKNKIKFK